MLCTLVIVCVLKLSSHIIFRKNCFVDIKKSNTQPEENIPVEYISALFMESDGGKEAEEVAYAEQIMHQFIQP